MKTYLAGEHLKHKGTLVRKVPLIAPLLTLTLSFFLMPLYFTSNAYNWWSLLLLPLSFALVSGLIYQRDEKNLGYRALFPLDIDLKRVWLAKIILGLSYMSLALALHLVGVLVLQAFLGPQATGPYPLASLLGTSAFLLGVNLWQVPLQLFLARKFGFLASLALGPLLALGPGLVLADGPLWIYSPYSWGLRGLVPLLGILPNGIPAPPGHPLASSPWVLPLLLSLGLFILLCLATGHWFSRGEVSP
ncbi:MAG: lantibiotic immunity ABC transporter MutE/EpiE family permease subunit [Tissierellia bacterium]|nr:lantibiotic immunity ABC transporter MutE/EpiE family permease subunit [Tissierellia bacterium]